MEDGGSERRVGGEGAEGGGRERRVGGVSGGWGE